MRSIETSGKTVEDAIQAGLKELECDITDVTYEVLDQGKPGLFGMFGRLARIRMTRREEEKDEFAAIGISSLKEPEKKAAPKAEPKPAPKAEARPAPKAEPKPKAEARPRPEPRPVEAKPAPAPHVEEPEEPLENHSPEQYSDNAKAACAFLETVTKGMGVDVNMAVAENDKHLSVSMTGDELGILIGRRGDTLDALQYLTSLVVNKKKNDYVRVSLDSENYRAKREEALTRLAERMAYKAQKSGRRVALEPMNPYERRILHSALQNHPAVTTHSEGEEPYRRVIITLK